MAAELLRAKNQESVRRNIELLRVPQVIFGNVAQPAVSEQLSSVLRQSEYEHHTLRMGFTLRQAIQSTLDPESIFLAGVLGLVYALPPAERKHDDVRTAIVTVPITHGISGEPMGINIAVTTGELTYDELADERSFCLHAASKVICRAAEGEYDLVTEPFIEQVMKVS